MYLDMFYGSGQGNPKESGKQYRVAKECVKTVGKGLRVVKAQPRNGELRVYMFADRN